MMFRKKPVVIEARQFNNDASSYELLQWLNEGQHAIGRGFATWHKNTLVVPTLEGFHVASPGDWIIRGVKGEHYPCKPDIFEETYEAVGMSMDDVYKDGSDHTVCLTCGRCVTCGDCLCKK